MNKDWTGNNNLYVCNHRTKDSMVAAHDLYCTHPDSIKLFLNKAKERHLDIPKQIWEPAAGLNSIVNVLKENKYDVLATDLVDRGLNQENLDFLQQTKESVKRYKPYLKCIFTNPPYAFAKEFVEKSLELLENDGICIMFLKLTFLESKKRYSLFKNHKLKHVWIYSERQGCGKNTTMFENSGAAAYAMFIWYNSYDGLPEIDWI